MPLQDRSASTAAGNKLLTAVPEVVITKERLPDAAEIPREWNPADLSSIELKTFTSPNLFNSPAAIAKALIYYQDIKLNFELLFLLEDSKVVNF